MKRIGVIGSVNRDTIVGLAGEETGGLGGVLYTAVALAHLAKAEAEIWLLCKIGRDVEGDVTGMAGALPNLRIDGISIVPEANYHSRIRYLPDGSKEERLSGEIEPLEWKELDPFVGRLDGLLVNFITGFELELETLRRLRRSFDGPLVMDVHSLTLGRKSSGERFWRIPDDWREWVSQVGVVQMNEAEAVLLGELDGRDEGSLRAFALGLLGLGPRGSVLTRGSRGLLAAYRDRGAQRVLRLAAEHPERAVDPTGCGDVFLAGLGLGVIAGWRFPRAVRLASLAAGLKSRFRGLEGLCCLRDLESF